MSKHLSILFACLSLSISLRGIHSFASAQEFKVAEIRRFEPTERSQAVFSSDGKRIVSVSYHLELFEWEVATGRQARRQPAQDKHRLIAMSRDFRRGLSVHRPNPDALWKLQLWDFGSGKSIRSWPEPDGAWETYGPNADLSRDAGMAVTLYQEPSIRSLPDGGTSIGGAKKELFVWNAQTGEAITFPPVHVDFTIIFSPDGKSLLANDSQDNVVLWDVKTGKRIRHFAGAPSSPIRLLMSDDGKYVVASCLNKEEKYPVMVWNANTGKVLYRLDAHKTFVQDLVFASDGRTLLYAEQGDPEKGIAPTLRLREIATGRQLGSFDGQTGSQIYSLAFSSDGALVVSSGDTSEKGLVQVWRLPK